MVSSVYFSPTFRCPPPLQAKLEDKYNILSLNGTIIITSKQQRGGAKGVGGGAAGVDIWAALRATVEVFKIIAELVCYKKLKPA